MTSMVPTQFWSAEEKFEVILVAGSLPARELDPFLRSRRLTRDQLEAWRQQALAGLAAAPPTSRASAVGDQPANASPPDGPAPYEPASQGESPQSAGEVTRLLNAWSNGDAGALEDLMPLVFDELRQIARRHFGAEPSSHTLQPTVLVSELYLKLQAQRRVDFHDRAKFFAVAARLIRRILVDHARKRLTDKRGGDVIKIPLMEQMSLPIEKAPDVCVLDDALKDLATIHPRQSRILELRIFGGFTIEEIADLEGLARSTVKRDWDVARLWLRKELKSE